MGEMRKYVLIGAAIILGAVAITVSGTLAAVDGIPEGATIRAEGAFDVWIVKYNNGKQFKRLVLSPTVYESYGHLRWEDVLGVPQSTGDSFVASNLVRAVGERQVYQLISQGDVGIRQPVDDDAMAALGMDADSIYEINSVDRDSYALGNSVVPVPEETVARVTFVIDGDTVDLDTGERVRLIGIDAPELGKAFYTEARSALMTLVLDKEVRLVKDTSERDVYDRLVRYIYVGPVFINFEMVRFGYAEATPFYPDTLYEGIFEAADSLARSEERGMWDESASPTVPPEGGYSIPACISTDCDCDDFDSQAHAQWFLENHDFYNTHALDGSPVDGFACESLP